MQNAEEISRVNRLRERFLSTPPAVCSERAKIVTQAYKDYDGEPAVLKRAKTLCRILSEMSIFIGDDELICWESVQQTQKFAHLSGIFICVDC